MNSGFKTSPSNIKEIFYCDICTKNCKPHLECYKNYCSFCFVYFKSLEKFKEHCIIYHPDNWCNQCSVIFITNHKHNS